jgi:hypothetical protein
MLIKWTFIAFGVATVALYVLGKVLAFFNPSRPGRAGPPVLQRVERALRWTLLIPLALAGALLAIALWRAG